MCKIVEGQRYSKRLNERQITALLKVTCQRPQERERDIIQVCDLFSMLLFSSLSLAFCFYGVCYGLCLFVLLNPIAGFSLYFLDFVVDV